MTDGAIKGRPAAEGDDVTELLELVKYEPPIPAGMGGTARTVPGATLHYDIENIKKYPDEFKDGEPVSMTEKLHGTWCCLGHHPDFGPLVTSKGLSARGLAIIIDDANAGNLYVQAYRKHEAEFEAARARTAPDGQPFYVVGEVYGRGVQDLHYGEQNPAFRVFDLYVGRPPHGRIVEGQPEEGRYLNPAEVEAAVEGLFPTVPLLYRGPFSNGQVAEHTDGKTDLGGKHIREGVVIRPETERESAEFGRVILKSVSGAYLTRKGGTEYE